MFIQSSKSRKQRKFRYTAPLHVRQGFVHVHISKELATKLGIKKRTIAVRKGDTIKVMAGGQKGKSGKVSSVNLRSAKILVEGIVRKNMKGKESMIPISSSNVYLTEIDAKDKLRQEMINRFKSAK
ncbi:MAG: 50S ribosomal protein L24 [Candidatus Micrarchaeota archaeon]|nr:50S ribosomal protein L24 [Candidatus Micrarchaeota archaeon]MDE1846447.1 50S ribosomal protein L24 [Candidatus Micrarchaeota archaeon]